MHNAILYCQFTVLRPIRSLPMWHGARWTALFRNAANAAGVNPEEAFAGLLPLHNGTAPLTVGASLGLRLVVSPATWAATQAMFRVLAAGFAAPGEFVAGHTITLASVSHSPAVPAAPFAGLEAPPPPITPEAIASQHPLVPGAQSHALRIHLLGPMRLTMPAGAKGEDRYVPPEFLERGPEAAQCFLSRLRLPTQWPALPAAPELCITQATTHWEDVGYNANRRMRLGGLVGAFTLCGISCPALHAAIMAGQYLGAGKNGRFGFGFYVATPHTPAGPEPQ